MPWNIGGKERRLYELLKRLGPDLYPTVYTMRWWGPGRSTTDRGVQHVSLVARQEMYTSSGRRSIREGIVFAASVFRLLFRRFDALDVDSVPFFPVIAARIVCSVRRRPLIGTWHEVWGRAYWEEYLGRSGRLAALIEALAIRCPDHIISDSELTTKRLRLAGARNVTTIPLGVDAKTLSTEVPTYEERAFDVIYMGRLLDHKKLDQLIDAADLCAHAGRPIRVLIVGEGPERAALEGQVRQRGLDHIAFRDFVAEDQYAITLRSARIFALPSQREGFGLVVLEANACGLPAIVVRHADNAAVDLVIDGETGSIVQPNADALAEGITRLLDQGLWSSCSAGAVSFAEQYDWDNIASSYETIVRSLTSARSSS